VYSECIALFGCEAIPRRIGINPSIGRGAPDYCNCTALNGAFTLEFCRCVRNPFTLTTTLEYWTPSVNNETYISGFELLCRSRAVTEDCATSASTWRLVARKVDGNDFYNVNIGGYLYYSFQPATIISYQSGAISLDCLFGSHSASLVPATTPCIKGGSLDFAPA
jgi:hypothetical protein